MSDPRTNSGEASGEEQQGAEGEDSRVPRSEARLANFVLEVERTPVPGGQEEVRVLARRLTAVDGLRGQWVSNDVVEAVAEFLVELVRKERSRGNKR